MTIKFEEEVWVIWDDGAVSLVVRWARSNACIAASVLRVATYVE